MKPGYLNERLSSSSQEMLTISEVARLLHAHPNTLRKWSDSGLLKAYRIGNRGDRRFKREDIDIFLLRSKFFARE